VLNYSEVLVDQDGPEACKSSSLKWRQAVVACQHFVQMDFEEATAPKMHGSEAAKSDS